MRVILAQPRGFCAGVVRAIEIVERALDKYQAPVYVRHEIVHNRHVVDSLKDKGAIFVEEIDQAPDGAHLVFSAHGVAKSVFNAAAARGLPVLDATCPLVSKVHTQAKRYVRHGRTMILIGHAGHPEVEGTIGQIDAPVHLISTVEDVAALDDPHRPAPRLCHPDDAERRRHQGGDRRPQGAASPTSSARTPPTSATPPSIARRPCATCARWPTSSWWWGPRTAPTPTACARSAAKRASPAT